MRSHSVPLSLLDQRRKYVRAEVSREIERARAARSVPRWVVTRALSYSGCGSCRSQVSTVPRPVDFDHASALQADKANDMGPIVLRHTGKRWNV